MGTIKTHIEDVRAEYTGPKELTVHSTGWQEMAYLPFDWATVENVPWEQHIVLPLTRMPDELTGELVDIEIEVDSGEEQQFYKTMSGLWSMGWYGRIHPDDIPHLSEPYIDGAFPKSSLIIPLEVQETKDGWRGERQIHIKGYEARQVRFPGKTTTQYGGGVGLTILQCCLFPGRLVFAVATIPIQVYIALDRIHMINNTPSRAQEEFWRAFSSYDDE